ncbi:MAG: PQQ-dependent dehydrogenase, methanol/ethanol family [Acidobacteriota bacterium]
MRQTAKLTLVAAAFAVTAFLVSAQQPGSAPAKQAKKKVDDAALRNASKNAEEWLTYGRDYSETHFSPLKQIDASNVKRLGLAWSWETESPAGANIEATPLVSNGVMYGILGWNVMFALDARTGAFKWRWDPEIKREHIATLCCGPVNRGVAIYNGKVYAGLLDGRLVSLDQETGKVLWQTQVLTDPDALLTSAVRVVKGKVIVGSSGAEQAVRGQFAAYDAETGKLAWRFYTVPGDPGKPFEHSELAMAAKTWTGEWWKMGGGGTVWDAMSYDPDADLLYIGTGNGGPWARDLRSPQGGDNLFLGSVLAVRPDTGKMVWYFQETPGENWDFTSVQPMILADIAIGGRQRKVLMHAPKNGFFYVLDRITGEFISGDKFVQRMTWATGLDAKGRPIEAKGARYGFETTRIFPGAAGARNWQPISFSPLTGLVYLPVNEASSNYAIDPTFQFKTGGRNTGMTNVRPRAGDAAAPAPAAPPVPQTAGPMKEPEGAENQPQITGRFLVAWDPKVQKARWRVSAENNFLRGGGTLATAGNLVFQGSIALNAETGEKLWDVDLGGNNVTPITYMLDGKQYVSIFARAQPNNRMFTFVLDGNQPLPPLRPAQ